MYIFFGIYIFLLKLSKYMYLYFKNAQSKKYVPRLGWPGSEAKIMTAMTKLIAFTTIMSVTYKS